MSKNRNQQVSVGKNYKQSCSSDEFMRDVQHALITDLIDMPVLKRRCYDALSKGIPAWRTMEWPHMNEAPPESFRRLVQTRDFLKRYIFAQDLHDPKDLSTKSLQAFLDSQKTFGIPEELSIPAQHVINKARCICANILGDFKMFELREQCKWGKRAAYNLPAREAYLFNRVKRLSYGSHGQLSVFKFATSGDKLLQGMLGRPKKAPYVQVTTVPKSYKAERVIAPDTTMGGYLSQGLGSIIRARLETRTHIRLASAKEKHQQIARDASVKGHYATIDMSKASDSFTWDHIKLLVPRSWWRILRAVRTPRARVEVDGVTHTVELNSYMLMGSGHTFPLQTVLFYSLAKATSLLLNSKKNVFTFGDDILLPTNAAIPFMKVMRELGFSINVEKSFWEGNFRESCGGDFYKGVDVRPVMPECVKQEHTVTSYLSFICRVYNGLAEKWHSGEIPTVLQTVYNHYRRYGIPSKGIAGLHGKDSCFLSGLPGREFVMPIYKDYNGLTICELPLLKVSNESLKISSNQKSKPYYWDTLRRGLIDTKDDDYSSPLDVPLCVGRIDSPVVRIIDWLRVPKRGTDVTYKYTLVKQPVSCIPMVLR